MLLYLYKVNNIPEHITFRLKSLPENPGIYQFFDNNGIILYVGKAKNLKKRVSSYFTKQHEQAKTHILVSKIADIHYIIVDDESEALLLENNLIKQHKPKYNIQLKDDKTYPWICIKHEAFPRVFSTRKRIHDGSKYFGPFPHVRQVNMLMQLFREMFTLRTCNLDLSPSKIQKRMYKVCLEYHIGKCKAPCVGLQTEQAYLASIQQIEKIIKGNVSEVIAQLNSRMKQAAEAYRFEEAHELKLMLEHLEKYKSKSTVVSPTLKHVDVLSMVEADERVYVNYLVVNDGAIVNGITVELSQAIASDNEHIFTYILPLLREKFQSQSKEVIIPYKSEWNLPGIHFTIPQKGDKKALLELSIRNAHAYKLEKRKSESIKNPEKHTERILETMKKDLRLKELPRHIECFDNSNFHGTNAVSACVVFKQAKPSKKDYRHFNVKTVEGPDDFATMREVVFRRYHRLIEEGQPLPQLVLIDGGKGQLGAALEALEKLGIRGKLAIIGIAKRLEELYYPGDSLPLYLDKRSETLKVIQHLRNEAHRFGITHHRDKRSKTAISNELARIEGIGPKTSEDLLRKFKSVKRVKEQTLDSLEQVVGKSKAEKVFNYFKNLS